MQTSLEDAAHGTDEPVSFHLPPGGHVDSGFSWIFFFMFFFGGVWWHGVGTEPFQNEPC